MVSSDLGIKFFNRVFRSQTIFPLNWISVKFELSLKQERSQVRVGFYTYLLFGGTTLPKGISRYFLERLKLR